MAQKKGRPKVLQGDVLQGDVAESREAPVERAVVKAQIVSPQLNDKQLTLLLGQTPKWAIKKRTGKAGQVYSYVPHGYVTDMLNKVFGWDWDLVLDPISNGQMYALETEEIPVIKNGKPTGEVKVNRYVAVAGRLIVRVHNPENLSHVVTIVKSGFGSQQWNSSMEFGDALKGAKSDLLKVCAVQLGIALDLYWDEQVELQEFKKKEEQRAELQRQAEEMANIINGIPKTPVAFISKCMSEYGLTADNIIEKFGVGDMSKFGSPDSTMTMSSILAMNENQVRSAWEYISSLMEKNNEN